MDKLTRETLRDLPSVMSRQWGDHAPMIPVTNKTAVFIRRYITLNRLSANGNILGDMELIEETVVVINLRAPGTTTVVTFRAPPGVLDVEGRFRVPQSVFVEGRWRRNVIWPDPKSLAQLAAASKMEASRYTFGRRSVSDSRHVIRRVGWEEGRSSHKECPTRRGFDLKKGIMRKFLYHGPHLAPLKDGLQPKRSSSYTQEDDIHWENTSPSAWIRQHLKHPFMFVCRDPRLSMPNTYYKDIVKDDSGSRMLTHTAMSQSGNRVLRDTTISFELPSLIDLALKAKIKGKSAKYKQNWENNWEKELVKRGFIPQ